MTFHDMLVKSEKRAQSFVCVGLDSDVSQLPACVLTAENPQLEFNKKIIDATYEYAASFKINPAFYPFNDGKGHEAIRESIAYAHTKGVPVILDSKRGDIGNTSAAYAVESFDDLGADAVTLHPYLGKEALQPFFDYKEKGKIVLARTSNPGSGEFQDVLTKQGQPLYIYVAKTVAENWSANNDCLLVTGGTYPEEIALIREVAGDIDFLVPGIGAQGGDLEGTVKAGLNSNGRGLLIHSARGVIFSSWRRNQETQGQY
jgi:orotidine-5'-phosphate decarboxylase